MLIQITHACRMGCSHCLMDATPDGRHMSMLTFQLAVEFILAMDWPMLMVSGGEPTDHPEIVSFLRLLRERRVHIALLSNGMFLSEDPVRRDEILGLADLVQVTNDERYYPVRVPHFEHSKVVFERRIRVVSPFGRAVANGLSCNRYAPMCFNLRSATRRLRSLAHAIRILRVNNMMCTPAIGVDGYLLAGETPVCARFGKVTDGNDVLTKNLIGLQCKACGLWDNVTPIERRAVWG